MNSEKIKKIFQIIGLSLLSTPIVSAQSIGQDLTLQESLVKFANDTLLMFEVGSATEVFLYFVAPIAGFYFIQKNMLSYGFELFEERLDRHHYGRTDDDIPNGIKGLSIVTSFITVQMLGMISAGILLATALISILLGALMQLGLLDGIELGVGNGEGRNTTTNNTGGNGTQRNQGGNQDGGGRNIDWGSIGETAANFTNNIQQAQQNRNERGIEEALSVFSNGTDVINLINKEPSDFRDHVDHIRDGKKSDASDVNSLEKVDERMKDIENDITDLESALRNDSGKTSGLDWSNDSELYNYDYDRLLQKLVNVNKELKRIKNNQKNQNASLQDHLDESWDDIQVYIKIHEFMDRLPGGPSRVASRNQLLENLVQEASRRNQLGGKSIQQGKNDFVSALQKLENFESAHKTIIQDLESELSDELKIDESEGDKLNRISTEDKKIIQAAKDVKQGVEDMSNNLNINNVSSPDISDIKGKMNNVKSLGNEINNQIQDIYSIIDSEQKFENESYKKLKKLS